MASRSISILNENYSPVVDQAKTMDMQEELVIMITNSHRVLQQIWDKIGLCERDREARTRKLLHYHNDLQSQMIEVETRLYNRMATAVEEMKLELQEVRKQIKQPEITKQDRQLQQLGLLQQERKLKQLVDDLHNKKYDRMENLLKLLEKEMYLCRVLNMAPFDHGAARTGVDDANVPSEEQMEEIQQHISMLLNEKNTRYKKMDQMRVTIKDLLDDLELLAIDEFQKSVMLLDEKTPSILSQDSLRKTNVWMNDLLAMQLRNKALLKDHLSQLIRLWDALDVQPPEREDFLSQYTHHGQNTLNVITLEIARYQELKRQHIGKFVVRHREELIHLWDKCCVSQEERARFVAFLEETFTENLLELHENEVSKWKSMYEDNYDIFNKVVRYSEVWEHKTIYDKKTQDSTRFYNRGGNLLQEERTRKRIEHELRKLELEIIQLIEEFHTQREDAKQFLIYGMQFQRFAQLQHEQLKLELENERKQRAFKRDEVGKCLVIPTMSKATSTRNIPASVAKNPRLNLGQKPWTSQSPVPATVRNTASPTKCLTPKKAPHKTPTSIPRKTPIVTPLNIMDFPVRINVEEIKDNHTQPPMNYPRESYTYSEFTKELKKKDDGIFNSTTTAEKMESS